MAFCTEHPKWDQNPKVTPLSETTSIPAPFIWKSTPGHLNILIFEYFEYFQPKICRKIRILSLGWKTFFHKKRLYQWNLTSYIENHRVGPSVKKHCRKPSHSRTKENRLGIQIQKGLWRKLKNGKPLFSLAIKSFSFQKRLKKML